MLRGGSWNNNARNCRSAYRNRNEPDNRNNNIGFRLAAAPTRTDVPREPAVTQSRLRGGQMMVQAQGGSSYCKTSLGFFSLSTRSIIFLRAFFQVLTTNPSIARKECFTCFTHPSVSPC